LLLLPSPLPRFRLPAAPGGDVLAGTSQNRPE